MIPLPPPFDKLSIESPFRGFFFFAQKVIYNQVV